MSGSTAATSISASAARAATDMRATSATAGSRASSKAVATCPGTSCSSISTTKAISMRWARRRLTPICARSRGGCHRKRLPHLVRHAARGEGAAGFPRPRYREQAEEGDRARRREGREASRQHAGDLPALLHSSGNLRRLCRRYPARSACREDRRLSEREYRTYESRGGGGHRVSAATSSRRDRGAAPELGSASECIASPGMA